MANTSRKFGAGELSRSSFCPLYATRYFRLALSKHGFGTSETVSLSGGYPLLEEWGGLHSIACRAMRAGDRFCNGRANRNGRVINILNVAASSASPARMTALNCRALSAPVLARIGSAGMVATVE